MQEKRNIGQIAKDFVANESGTTAMEYGLIGGLIGVVIIGAVDMAGVNIAEKLRSMAVSFSSSSQSHSPAPAPEPSSDPHP